MREVEVQVGSREYLPDGTCVETRIIDPLKISKNPNNTAIHEAMHAVAAPDKVVEASVVADGDSLGHVQFTSHDSAAAAAPHAFGMSGTGFDTWSIEASGGSISAASTEARIRLAGKSEHILILAGYLQEHKNISGNEVRRVIDRVDQGDRVIIQYKKPDGTEKTVVEKGVKSETVIVNFEEQTAA